MNTLLIIILAFATPLYALLWHNQPARNQREKKIAIEAAFTLLLNPSWLANTASRIVHLFLPAFQEDGKPQSFMLTARQQSNCNLQRRAPTKPRGRIKQWEESPACGTNGTSNMQSRTKNTAQEP